MVKHYKRFTTNKNYNFKFGLRHRIVTCGVVADVLAWCSGRRSRRIETKPQQAAL
jgi:hypothetical protein